MCGGGVRLHGRGRGARVEPCASPARRASVSYSTTSAIGKIGVKKKAGPDRERGAGNSNVQAIHGMPLAERCPWAHIQCGSAFFLQRIELGNPQISDRRGIR